MNLGLFLISAAILALEVLHMRILSVQMWYHHAYVVVTLAMLGFAVSGTVATLWRCRDAEQAAQRVSWCATLFGITAVAGHIATAELAYSETTIVGFLLLLVPYFFGGMVVTLALTYGVRIHVRYFWNLLGSALGAWLFIWWIQPLGAERLLIRLATLGPVTAIAFLPGARADRGPRYAGVIALVGLAVLLDLKPDFLRVRINPEKRQHIHGELIDSRWTPLTRLDVFSEQPDYWKRRANVEPPGVIHIVQDGAAGSLMYSEKGFTPFDLFDSHAVAYVPHAARMLAGGSAPSVAIIGVGGGTDIRTAKTYGAGRVLALEINEEMARLTRDDYSLFNGDVLQLPGVELAIGEGRSTLERRGEKFDIIILAGADTYTAGAYGAFVLSESYLYTDEAIDVYLDHLTPTGTVGILRFYDEPHREGLRLFGMALQRLRARGVEKPSRRVAVLRSNWSSGTVISAEPLSDEAIALYRKADDQPFEVDDNEVLYLPGDTDSEFAKLAAAVEGGTEEEFYAAYEARYGLNVRPVTDDSPFFFNFHHLWSPEKYENSAFARAVNTASPIAPSILRTLFLQIGGLVLALVLLPLFFFRRESLRRPHAGRQLGFFMAVGAAFMLLEISTAQRLVLFLGHPTYSLTVVLFSFLFFAGLGALLTGRFAKEPSRALRRAGIVLCIAVAVFTVAMRSSLPALIHLELASRVGVAIAMLAPLNFLMGMPFPIALRRLQDTEPKLVPWAIGANGGASVMGSVFAVGVAMETGFTVVGALALLCYAFAIWVGTSGPFSSRATSDP
ncbi:MAG: hypothetical protein IPM29_05535 [Planctomycetes bacterium]|nr:hypothetical protein [Planctomycetota bacterium]